MRNHKYLTVAALMLALVSFRCAQNSAPELWLSKPEDIPLEPFGGWVEVTFTAEHEQMAAGELIALETDTLYLANQEFVAIPKELIKKATLTVYNPESNRVVTSCLLWSLSTLSNGFLLFLTAPLNLIAGTGSSIMRSYEPVISWPDEGWERLAAFSRFPQGLPKNVQRHLIVAKRTRQVFK